VYQDVSREKKVPSANGAVSLHLLDTVGATPISLTLCVVTLAVGISLVGLAFYHCGLVFRNMTTHEKIRRMWNHDHSPHLFDQGIKKNVVWFLTRSFTDAHPSEYVEA
jgi:hypothetical protein